MHQYKELQSQFSEAGQKHAKDLENIGVQVAQLEAQVTYSYLFFIVFKIFISISLATIIGINHGQTSDP